MLVDDVTIRVAAGHGGRGAVAFNKNLMSLGPVGGTGGAGGSVYAVGVSDLSALNQFRHKKDIKAQDGQEGRGQFRDGATGADVIIKMPVGTVIHNHDTKTDVEILQVGQKVLLAQGGIGGRGNFHFRSATNTSPKQFQGGRPGEAFTLRLELKLIADVGLIGFPNAGKSTLLNILTSAKAKVANYPFTTLEPNLGVYYNLVLADIPGLIEGAAVGKGLGFKFLRHVERTRVLLHCISCEHEDVLAAYKTIMIELTTYNKKFAKAQQYVVLTKTDTVTPEVVKKHVAALKKTKCPVLAISAYDDATLAPLQKVLNEIEAAKIAT